MPRPPPPLLRLILELAVAVSIIEHSHADHEPTPAETCGNECYSCSGRYASFCNSGAGFCCSSSNWCGNSAAHCASGSTNCAGCRGYSDDPCSDIVWELASNADLSQRRAISYNTGYGHNQGECLLRQFSDVSSYNMRNFTGSARLPVAAKLSFRQ
eukprot:SAG31_NODE_5280_length_2635_cov_2.574921_3_plen_156_part_00